MRVNMMWVNFFMGVNFGLVNFYLLNTTEPVQE